MGFRGAPATAAVMLALATPALAEKDFCSDRPGRSDATCTLDTGRLQVETSLADWAHSRDREEVEDTVLINDVMVRYGVTQSTELRFGWTSLGIDRTRDRTQGGIRHVTGTGDVTLGLRQAVDEGGPDHQRMRISVQPFVTLPVGRDPVGDGTWSAGVIVPVQFSIGDRTSVVFDSEVDAAPDEDGAGRHLAYALVSSLTYKVTQALRLGGEAFVRRDRDPAEHATLASLDATAAYRIGHDSQIDVNAYTGLTRATPRIELLAGVTHRF